MSKPPTPPEHSLPSYDEPTPETKRKMSREDEAELALGRTDFSPGARPLLIVAFLLTIMAVVAAQIIARQPIFEMPGVLPSAARPSTTAFRYAAVGQLIPVPTLWTRLLLVSAT